MLTETEAIGLAKELLSMRAADKVRLDEIHSYWRGKQMHPSVPLGAPREAVQFARMSRVNICRLVVAVPAQSMVVTGFRDPGRNENEPEFWATWEANKLSAQQAGLYRGTFAYGVSYAVVLPGSPTPVVRCISPRRLTAAYGSDPDWPYAALELRTVRGGVAFRLLDETSVYEFKSDSTGAMDPSLTFKGARDHMAGRCPVVRFVNTADLESEPDSEIEAIIPLQDQLDETTFSLKVAERYAAFRQRYIIGWAAESESQVVQLAASRIMELNGDPSQVKVGEFDQTDLSGYLGSRKATLENFGIVSQVPPHNLVGQMVNLSAEALVAAEVGASRKNSETRTGVTQAWGQVADLNAVYTGSEVPDGATVIWKDTEARSLAQTVDALGKMVQMLGVPAEAAWPRIPGVTQQDIDGWKLLASQAGGMEALLAELVGGQTSPPAPAEPPAMV